MVNFIILRAFNLVASYPGPSRGGGERAWYTLHAHALGDPRKMWGNRILSYTLRLLSIELYVMQNPRTITMVTRWVTMEIPAHEHAVCTRPFLLLLKGLGMRLSTLILHCTSKCPQIGSVSYNVRACPFMHVTPSKHYCTYDNIYGYCNSVLTVTDSIIPT